MAKTQNKPKGPDLVPGNRACRSSRWRQARWPLRRRAGAAGAPWDRGVCGRARHARITPGRSSTVSWSTIPSVVHGITLASICAQAKRCARPPSVRSRAGRWNSAMARYSWARNANARRRSSRDGGSGQVPEKIVIVGGGAAGFAAAEKLRRERYQGSIVMLSDDEAPPVDRPNLSKDYLAGKAPEDWIPLRGRKLLFKERYRPASQDDCRRHRRRARRGRARGWKAGFPMTGCCLRPAPNRFA